MDPLFFESPDFHFILANGGILNASGPKDFPSNISASLDAFTKAFYSAIMVDLGSTMTTTVVSNPRLLEHYSQIIGKDGLQTPWLRAGPANDTYENMTRTMGDALGPLEIRPSTFYTQYLCQVPKQKPTGQLLVSIIVADLVLLSTIWALVKFVTTMVVEGRDHKSQFCQGCFESFELEQASARLEIQSRRSAVASRTTSRAARGAGRRNVSNISTVSTEPLLPPNLSL